MHLLLVCIRKSKSQEKNLLYLLCLRHSTGDIISKLRVHYFCGETGVPTCRYLPENDSAQPYQPKRYLKLVAANREMPGITEIMRLKSCLTA